MAHGAAQRHEPGIVIRPSSVGYLLQQLDLRVGGRVQKPAKKVHKRVQIPDITGKAANVVLDELGEAGARIRGTPVWDRRAVGRASRGVSVVFKERLVGSNCTVKKRVANRIVRLRVSLSAGRIQLLQIRRIELLIVRQVAAKAPEIPDFQQHFVGQSTLNREVEDVRVTRSIVSVRAVRSGQTEADCRLPPNLYHRSRPACDRDQRGSAGLIRRLSSAA